MWLSTTVGYNLENHTKTLYKIFCRETKLKINFSFPIFVKSVVNYHKIKMFFFKHFYNTIQILFASSTHKNIHLYIHNIFYTIVDDAGGI